MYCSEEIPDKSAVHVRDLCKSYGSGPPVISNICMNVQKRSIYGLLGASGSGKTSLLSCVVGATKWDSGEIFVFGKRPGSRGSRILSRKCGYMPQDVSLYDSLTFHESAVFFGKLYNMSNPDVECQVRFLEDLLHMSSVNQVIGTLSGGQKRRVSLALTLIHSPDLLILDEPTVGLDPLLRKSIWNHLYNLALNQNKTIVITTHYTEEVKLANMVGIMRKGRLLAEDTPANLIRASNCNFLEDVMLNLCRADESANGKKSDIGPVSDRKMNIFKSAWKNTIKSIIAVDQEDSAGVFKQAAEFDAVLTEDVGTSREMSNNSSQTTQLNNFYQELKKVHGITVVQSLNIWRQKIFLAFYLLISTIQGSIMFNTMGWSPREMNVGVVNRELLNWTSQCDAQHLQNNSCDFTFLSCKFLNEIQTNDVVNLIQFSSMEDARTKVHEGSLKGYITFPSNFSQYTLESFATWPFASNESMDGSRIGMHLDFSEYIASLFMLEHFFESHSAYLGHLAESCQMNGNMAKIPFQFKKPVYESLDDSYTEFFVPGIILSFVFVLIASITGILYITDKNNGTLGRGRVAGLKTVHILFGYLITQVVLGILQIFLWSMTTYIWLGYSVRGPIWLFIFICLLVCIGAVAFGLLTGIVFPEAIQALVFWMFLTPCIFLYGGMVWPLEGMSQFPRYIGYFLPTTLPILSLRSVVVRGLSLTHPLVWPGVIAAIAWIAVPVFCVTVVYKR